MDRVETLEEELLKPRVSLLESTASAALARLVCAEESAAWAVDTLPVWKAAWRARMSEKLWDPEATVLESAVAAIANPTEKERREDWACAMSPDATAD